MSSNKVPVLIAGAGPVGLVTAYTLAHHGIRCMLIERNASTTKWPKMDITNVRSMEILRRLGLADELREQGVSQEYSFDVIISTGLGEKGEEITRWELPSPNDWREKIKRNNDGSMPREPYQRCSQAIFEAWLAKKIKSNSLIESHWATKLVDVFEKEDGIVATIQDVASGEERTIESEYLVGCDGGGSVTRKRLSLGLTGGPVPAAMYLVHFKSRDLSRLHRQGQFWHIFFTHGGVIIAQDEVETWTTHLPVPLDFDPSSLDPKQQIYQVLGGNGDKYEIDVDEILVSSVWRPNSAVADAYRSAGGRSFIAGDAAHQNIPTGGYGMNTGLGDAYDIAWKLAMVLNGAGGEALLGSYASERRPVAIRNVSRAADHLSVHQNYASKALEIGAEAVLSRDAKEGLELKSYIKTYVDAHDGENKEHGIEMDYRLRLSPVVVSEEDAKEPDWKRRAYIPSTIPGSRAPHVFLANGKTSIFDLFGKEYTIVDFSPSGSTSQRMLEMAKADHLPLSRVHLPDETHAREVWGTDIALIRPDHFVAWRSSSDAGDEKMRRALRRAFGREWSEANDRPSENVDGGRLQFAGANSSFNQDHQAVEGLAAFQT